MSILEYILMVVSVFLLLWTGYFIGAEDTKAFYYEHPIDARVEITCTHGVVLHGTWGGFLTMFKRVK